MRRVRSALFSLPFLALMLLACQAASASTRDSAQSVAQIDRMIATAQTGDGPRARYAAAQLANIARIDGARFDDLAVERVADLLAAPDDIVRFWAARTLGNLGARGKVFAARLQALLPWADCLQGYSTSATGFRLALKQMGIVPEPATVCEGS